MTEAERIASRLHAAVAEGHRLLAGVAEERTARRPAGRDWCAREVLGHLIDSACNNHRRFIINQNADQLIVDPYEQNDWVERQRYADTPMTDLLRFWTAYNSHIERVIRAMPEDVLARPRGPMGSHSFPYAAVARDARVSGG